SPSAPLGSVPPLPAMAPGSRSAMAAAAARSPRIMPSNTAREASSWPSRASMRSPSVMAPPWPVVSWWVPADDACGSSALRGPSLASPGWPGSGEVAADDAWGSSAPPGAVLAGRLSLPWVALGLELALLSAEDCWLDGLLADWLLADWLLDWD